MGDTTREVLRHLCREIGPRPPGSAAEARAADWLCRKLVSLGLEAGIEEFESPSHAAASARLTIDGKAGEITCLPVLFSRAGASAGRLVFLDRETAARDSLAGMIGIYAPSIENGILTRNREVAEFEKKGLGALVVISPHFERLDTKIIRHPQLNRMPVVTVSFRDATRLLGRVGGEASVEVFPGEPGDGRSRNVVARIPGRPGDGRWLFAGAHYDTAPFCEGALDNAGGTAALIGAAEILAREKLPADIYLVAFGSEEYGALDGTGRGPWDFLGRRESMIENCLGYLNLDNLGNRPADPRVLIGGPAAFREIILGAPTAIAYRHAGKNPAVTADFGPAEMHGIPYAWFKDNVFSVALHTPQDTLELIDPEIPATCARDIASVIRVLAEKGRPWPVIREKGVTVRQARHADIPAMKEITSAAFGPVSTARMQEDFFGEKLGGRSWDHYKNREVENYCRNHVYRVVVAECDGRVVGYGTCLFDAEKGIAQIGNNAVHPAYQGRGIGKLIQSEVGRRLVAEGYDRFTVMTLSNDIAAQRIYEKLGYRKYIESWHYLRKGK